MCIYVCIIQPIIPALTALPFPFTPARDCRYEKDANFINLQVTSMMDKWYGETEKRVQAIFSLVSHLCTPLRLRRL